MKRLLLSLAALALLCLLSACFPEPPVEIEEEPPDEIPPAKTYYTLRLADDKDILGIGVGAVESGSASNSASGAGSASRALTRENAIASHQFFEAVFVYNDNGINRVARTAWEVGEVPELHGVHRGVRYNNVGVPGNNTGSALLFVGTKDDKTLLALGRLVEVDGIGLTSTPQVNPIPVISDETRSVTFEVASLKATVGTGGSFRTSTSANTAWGSMSATFQPDIFIHYNYRKVIPLYKLTAATVYGAYNFDIDTTGAVNPQPTFANFAGGIVLKQPQADSRNLEMRNPRYFVTEGQYNYSSMLVQDNKTQTAWEPGYGTGTTFSNPVRFRFTNVPDDGSVFALVFEIFVYNLTTLPAAAAGPAAEKWRISPGMGTKWLDLDDGEGEGGAVLLGSGTVEAWMDNLPGS